MSWFAQSSNETEAEKDSVLMFVAVDFDFPSGHVRLWSGVGDLVISGNTYTGVGDLGSISIPQERAGLTLERKTYQLSGADVSLLAESELDGSFGRSVTEYFGFIDPTTRVLVATPEINWEGRIDAIRRVDSPDNPIIEVNAEHRMVLLDQTDGWRYTHEHQQQFYSGDTGFEEVAAIQLKEVIWGGASVNPGGEVPVYNQDLN